MTRKEREELQNTIAREVLAEMAGTDVNASLNEMIQRIFFGTKGHPKFTYVELTDTRDMRIADAQCNLEEVIEDLIKHGYHYSDPIVVKLRETYELLNK